ncbi:DUF1642 domain-containing protein [Lactiplantibacillus plantarum]|uniref:DUF1642 domain-containing protein n=1 Tax=Lactiplantibacillus plantarum TaxID=1590 RepID=UPI00265AE1FC|nr:DUF1642 domain-containing protein [Lactiplantibacillus plantarum]
MIKVYRKTATINAEQFDCSDDMFNHYGLIDRGGHIVDGLHVDDMCFIPTLEGQMKINIHDWIATGVNGEHWAIADDVFKQTYAELPMIPKDVACLIKQDKEWDYNLGMVFDDAYSGHIWEIGVGEWIIENSESFARAWLDGYVLEEEK